jgi:hypothetical protein
MPKLRVANQPHPVLKLARGTLTPPWRASYRYLIIMDFEGKCAQELPQSFEMSLTCLLATCDYAPSPIVEAGENEIIEFPWVHHFYFMNRFQSSQCETGCV